MMMWTDSAEPKLDKLRLIWMLSLLLMSPPVFFFFLLLYSHFNMDGVLFSLITEYNTLLGWNIQGPQTPTYDYSSFSM